MINFLRKSKKPRFLTIFRIVVIIFHLIIISHVKLHQSKKKNIFAKQAFKKNAKMQKNVFSFAVFQQLNISSTSNSTDEGEGEQVQPINLDFVFSK